MENSRDSMNSSFTNTSFSTHNSSTSTPFQPNFTPTIEEESLSPPAPAPVPARSVPAMSQPVIAASGSNDPYHASVLNAIAASVLKMKGVSVSADEAPFSLSEIIETGEGSFELNGHYMHVEPPVDGKASIQFGSKVHQFSVEDLDASNGDESHFLLQVSSPAVVSEFAIHSALTARLGADAKEPLNNDFMLSSSLHVFGDSNGGKVSCMLVPKRGQANLQTVIDLFHKQGKAIEEPLVMFYAIEMMRVVGRLHGLGILHCNVVPSSFVIKNDECDDWGQWTPDRSAGWKNKGLVMTDFHRSIDLKSSKDVSFSTSYAPLLSAFPFIAQLQKTQTWSAQIDLFGICNTLHLLMHGTPIEVTTNPKGFYTCKSQPKSSWQVTLWQMIFDSLLNGGADSAESLDELRHMLEERLAKPQLTKDLRTQFCAQVIMLLEQS